MQKLEEYCKNLKDFFRKAGGPFRSGTSAGTVRTQRPHVGHIISLYCLARKLATPHSLKLHIVSFLLHSKMSVPQLSQEQLAAIYEKQQQGIEIQKPIGFLSNSLPHMHTHTLEHVNGMHTSNVMQGLTVETHLLADPNNASVCLSVCVWMIGREKGERRARARETRSLSFSRPLVLSFSCALLCGLPHAFFILLLLSFIWDEVLP